MSCSGYGNASPVEPPVGRHSRPRTAPSAARRPSAGGAGALDHLKAGFGSGGHTRPVLCRADATHARHVVGFGHSGRLTSPRGVGTREAGIGAGLVVGGGTTPNASGRFWRAGVWSRRRRGPGVTSTLHRWIGRYGGNVAGLTDRSHRQVSCPAKG